MWVPTVERLIRRAGRVLVIPGACRPGLCDYGRPLPARGSLRRRDGLDDGLGLDDLNLVRALVFVFVGSFVGERDDRKVAGLELLDIHSGEREPTQALDAVRGPKKLREQRKKRRENDGSHQVARGLRKADLNGIVTHGSTRLASRDPTFNRSAQIRVFTHSPARLGPNRRPRTRTNAGWGETSLAGRGDSSGSRVCRYRARELSPTRARCCTCGLPSR